MTHPAFSAFTPDGRALWIGSYSGVVAVVDVETAEVVEQFELGGWTTGVSFSPGGELAYLSTTPPGTASRWRGAVRLAPALFGRWKPGGRLRAFDATAIRQVAEIPLPDLPMAMAVAPLPGCQGDVGAI